MIFDVVAFSLGFRYTADCFLIENSGLVMNFIAYISRNLFNVFLYLVDVA